MRIVRLLGVVLTILTAGLLLAAPAGAQPPTKLTDHVTDTNGVLTDSGRAAVNSAIDRLQRDQHIQLWVVYVDNYNRFKPENWADQTRGASGLGTNDVLLAVATNTKLYSLTAPGVPADELNSLRSNKIEPAVNARDWSGAAVAAADGLNKSTPSAKRNWLPIAIGVVVVIVVIVVIVLLYRRHRRRRAAQRAATEGQPSLDGADHSVGSALSTADARVRQISDYVAQYQRSVGSEAKKLSDEAKRQLAAARAKQASNEREAITHAVGASRLAAQAQTRANADVLAAHRSPRR